jgi:glycosyltransferase involved in cell wall biosynthesis
MGQPVDSGAAVPVHTDAGPHQARGPDLACLSRCRVSVVIPALNEAANLRYVLPRIPAGVHEVLLVDGRSTDGTMEVARQLYPAIRLVTQEGTGKGAALRGGFAAAAGDVIVMLDADGSTDPAEIPRFVQALQAGADLAKGSRFLPGGGTADMSLLRRLGNRAFVVLVRVLFGGRYSDLCYGYNAFWPRILPQLRLDCDGFEIETLINVRALRVGLRVAEVPSFEAKRVHGQGRLRTFPDGWRVLRTIFREWRAALRYGMAPAPRTWVPVPELMKVPFPSAPRDDTDRRAS